MSILLLPGNTSEFFAQVTFPAPTASPFAHLPDDRHPFLAVSSRLTYANRTEQAMAVTCRASVVGSRNLSYGILLGFWFQDLLESSFETN